jgi:hypothetical protein
VNKNQPKNKEVNKVIQELPQQQQQFCDLKF